MEKYLFLLRNSIIFTGMNDDEIISVLKCMESKTAVKSKDSYIMRAGESTDCMGVLLRGEAIIIQEDIWGHRNVISKLKPGEPFAEPFAASQGAVLNISVVATEECEILYLDINRIMAVCPNGCAHHTHIIRNLVSVLAHKNLMLNDKITHMSKRTTRDKLLSYLSAESVRHSSLSFDIPYDRQQLADFLCVERAAMSAEISRLRKAGVLESDKNHFVLKENQEI